MFDVDLSDLVLRARIRTLIPALINNMLFFSFIKKLEIYRHNEAITIIKNENRDKHEHVDYARQGQVIGVS